MLIPALEKVLTKPFIQNYRLQLRYAAPQDIRACYEGMYHSNATQSMYGAPLYPECPPKTWEAFQQSWREHYFQGEYHADGMVVMIQTVTGEAIGALAVHELDDKGRVEVDYWMFDEKWCGKGLGSEALHILCDYLFAHHGIAHFWMNPSARNPRSVKAAQKIGFKMLPLNAEEGEAEFGCRDYDDSVLSPENPGIAFYIFIIWLQFQQRLHRLRSLWKAGTYKQVRGPSLSFSHWVKANASPRMQASREPGFF